jgi:hypothetical protein
MEKKRDRNKIEDGQNRWLSATRAFISVRRVFQSEPDFGSAINIGAFFIYFFSPIRNVLRPTLKIDSCLRGLKTWVFFFLNIKVKLFQKKRKAMFTGMAIKFQSSSKKKKHVETFPPVKRGFFFVFS